MKKTSKFIMVILVICLASGCFWGCNKLDKEKDVKTFEYSDYYKGVNFDKTITNLAENKKTEYKIVVPDKKNECVNFAASEFQSFVLQSTSATLEIITDKDVTYNESNKYISFGKTKILEGANLNFDYSTLNLDGFFIKTAGNQVLIDAFYDRGVLYGAYDFLEKFLDVKFVAPDCTVTKEFDKVPIYEMNIVEVPAFNMRSFLDGNVFHVTIDQDFTARTRNNSSMAVLDAKHGGASSMYGRNQQHNFSFFVPYEIYGKTHPEFYVDHPVYGRTLCLTNGITSDGKLDDTMEESVAKIVISEMKKDIIAMPNISYFSFDQEDGTFFCSCDKCTKTAEKYLRSGILLRFVNTMATELQNWAERELNGRKVNIVTFAYDYTSQPPVKKENNQFVPIDDTVKAANNVVMRLAQDKNSYYSYWDERQLPEVKSALSNWQACCNHFMFWGYDTDFTDHLSYFPSTQAMYDNIQGARKMGITYLMMQSSQSSTGNWQSLMKLYVYTKLLWNPDRDVSVLLNEFIDLYFGDELGASVHELVNLYNDYYAILINEKNAVINNTVRVITRGNFASVENMNVNILTQAIDIMEKAIKKISENQDYSTKDKRLYQKRAAMVITTPMYTLLKNYGMYYPTADESQKLDFAKYFFSMCALGGVDKYAEGRSIDSLKVAYFS